jgi:thiamine biosynthesis protein ThiS
MKIIANDSEFEVSHGCSLPEFLESIGYQLGIVVVERNRQALAPSEATETILEEGDRLEIVKIVAGG